LEIGDSSREVEAATLRAEVERLGACTKATEACARVVEDAWDRLVALIQGIIDAGWAMLDEDTI